MHFSYILPRKREKKKLIILSDVYLPIDSKLVTYKSTIYENNRIKAYESKISESDSIRLISPNLSY